MRNKILLLVCLFSITLLEAQNICGEVMYKEEARISLFFQTISVTKFNNKIAYTKFLHYKDARAFLDGTYDPEGSSKNEELTFSLNKDTGFVYNDEHDTYFTETFWKPTIIVKEDKFDWNWKLTNETKKIGKFNCQKASVKFRGRTFIAWFTKEISTPFGPSKFKGLPGLILEVYDDEKKWYMKALKVKLYDTKKCNINLTEFEQAKPKAVSVKRYLKMADSLFIDEAKKELSRLGKEARIHIPNRCDRLYNGQMVEIFDEK